MKNLKFFSFFSDIYMMRAELKTLIPANYRNRRGRPLLLVVHASRGYDYNASAQQAIQQTLSKSIGHLNILEVVSSFKGSYLALPSHLRTQQEYAGSLLNKDFLVSSGHLLDTDTFVFIGGRANKCLLATALSILIAKLTPLEKLFAEQDSHPHLEKFLQKPLPEPKGKPLELNLHFNCEAIYPSHISLKWYSRNAEILDWSPNLPWVMMRSLFLSHRKVFGKLGKNIQFFVNGKKQKAANIKKAESNVKINLHYWSSASQMEEDLMAA